MQYGVKPCPSIALLVMCCAANEIICRQTLRTEYWHMTGVKRTGNVLFHVLVVCDRCWGDELRGLSYHNAWPKHIPLPITLSQATPALLAKATNMKVIGRAGVGIDNIDVAEATRKGVLVMNTPGGNTVSTAQLAISLLCSAARLEIGLISPIPAVSWYRNVGSEPDWFRIAGMVYRVIYLIRRCGICRCYQISRRTTSRSFNTWSQQMSQLACLVQLDKRAPVEPCRI